MRHYLQTAVILVLATWLGMGHALAQEPVSNELNLSSTGFSRQFAGKQISCQVVITAEGLSLGGLGYINVDFICSQLGGNVLEQLRSTVLNGYVVLALPPGIDPAGGASLYYYDQSSQSYQFMYSKAYPNLPYLAGAWQAAEETDSATPTGIFAGLARISTALDPAVSVIGPEDARLLGGDSQYALVGKSWLIPANIEIEELVQPYKQGVGLLNAPRLRLRLPVSVASEVTDPHVVVYAGGLSTAVLRTELLPEELTATTMPLGPVPQAEPATAPDEAEQVELASAEPMPIPVLSYSYEWLSVEQQLELSSALGMTATPELEIDPSGGQPSVADSWATEVEAPDAPTPSEQSARVEQEVKQGEREPTEQETGVVEVELGTLSTIEQEHRVPLKAISLDGPPTGWTGGGRSEQMRGPEELKEMVLIPAGYFLMGSPITASVGDKDEQPQAEVYTEAYYIDKYPVTNRQFFEFVMSSGYQAEGSWDRYYDQAMLDLPVVGVSYNDAVAYARWAGKRLPSEAEWEKAARGTDGSNYPWGDVWKPNMLPRGVLGYDLLFNKANESPYGVMAMVGVVWQWTSSAHHLYPFDPAAQDEYMVLRGGGYGNDRNGIRCANRYAEDPRAAFNTFGFRCAKDAD